MKKKTSRGAKTALKPFPSWNLDAEGSSLQNDDAGLTSEKVVIKEVPPKSHTIFLGNVPHGFFENEMRQYFRQFGKVTRLMLARSQKTGNSCGHGFIEFEDSDVAQIVANTMNNYLMCGKILKCEVIPADRRIKYPRVPYTRATCPYIVQKRERIERMNEEITEEESKRDIANRVQRLYKRIRSLQEEGASIEMSDVTAEDWSPWLSEDLCQPEHGSHIDEASVEEENKWWLQKQEREAYYASLMDKISFEKLWDESDDEKAELETPVNPSRVAKGDKIVMPIYESDEEISFKTPMNVVKKLMPNKRKTSSQYSVKKSRK